MKEAEDVAEALKQSPHIIRSRCLADVYNNEDEIKHRCQRMAKEDSRYCWQHENSFHGFARRRTS